MKQAFRSFPLGAVKLLPSMFMDRCAVNREYLLSLNNRNLLQNHYLEAGLLSGYFGPTIMPENKNAGWRFEDFHWGWESPTSHFRGHFLGYWLSAMARTYAATEDPEVKIKADRVVTELGRCQAENGGEWVGPIPEKHFKWALERVTGCKTTRHRTVYPPHYIVHTTMMGLFEMYSLAGNEQSLEILLRWADWFHRWSSQLSREQMDNILDLENGAMLEFWADLYSVTGKQEHLDLVNRYYRTHLFEPLLAGEDVLANKHANSTIPEAQGAARAWEVTGDQRWRDVAEAYWRQAVTERGAYCTGGQTSGEVWSPPFELAARLGDRTQEFCVVYNMMRLSEYLLRWTGDVTYADYWERNLYNGVLAQQHPQTGMVAYFLPLRAGGAKEWSTPTMSFQCCLGTIVQASAAHGRNVYFEDDDGLAVCQYIPTELSWQRSGTHVRVKQTEDRQTQAMRRPGSWAFDLEIECDQPLEFTLKLRLPWWLDGQPTITVDGKPEPATSPAPGFHSLRRTWTREQVHIDLPKRLASCPLPGGLDTLAFIDGPVVLAGLCEEERALYGDEQAPETILVADDERQWDRWMRSYRTRNQERGMKFIPLYDVRDERYTVYFPVRPVR